MEIIRETIYVERDNTVVVEISQNQKFLVKCDKGTNSRMFELGSKEFMDNVTNSNIKAYAVKEYSDVYSMQQYVYEEQVESKE